ncbi:FAD dependent oxidoreductase [Exophiala viscosa]|uniref:FAD dependent oxidoreductase n=1 Tax=Exophiala viscosa TaxID=2486360 RepID=UPI00218CB58B|nr:FAD dependent oxidoreductase [Exophiala viscosa]
MSRPSTQAVPPLQDKDVKINIVGAGVFGLSTAIHLAQRGYKSVTIFDKQPYHESRYSYFNGCDAASADMNKIFRSAYGGQTEYQSLSIEAFEAWNQWNAEIASGEVPPGMTKDDKVFVNNGNLSLTDKPSLPPFELATVRNMHEAGFPDSQLITYDPSHVKIATERGLGFAIDPFDRQKRGQEYLGVLDTTGGTTLADKACSFALYKAERLGVRTVFGPTLGAFESFLRADGEIVGIRTLDGKSHYSGRTIIACGGWTPTLLPELDSVCETTAGSVAIMKLPTDLARRYSAKNFPSWMYKMRDGAEGGLYGFPATSEGYMKIGYRGTKYTNPKVQKDGRERSVPVTRYTEAERIVDQIPTQALAVIKQFIADFLPDLPANGVNIDMTRLCWYTDSWDNHFVIDHVPEHKNVLVASAGSGHAFKYLPNIGAWVADVLEGKGLDRQLIRSWQWRTRPDQEDRIINELMQGSAGRRSLKKTELSTPRHLKLRQTANL